MLLSLAPMEGLTGYVFRNVHAECFGALDRYYTPFVEPPQVGHSFKKQHYKEIDPRNGSGLNVIPQVLTKNADEFVWASELLAQMGYDEVNLNLGCPSGTVAAKGKGSGFLGRLDDLETFLRDVTSRSTLPVSVKTRIGVQDDAEYAAILELYCSLPLKELIVHPRVQKEHYKGTPRWEPYGATLESALFPVAYNGDIFSVQDASALLEAFPRTQHIMLGRGILTNPALAREIAGGPALTVEELRRFHDKLYAAYVQIMGGNAVFRMKEWWFYAKFAFDDPLAIQRAIRKIRKVDEYEAAIDKIFRSEQLSASPVFRG